MPIILSGATFLCRYRLTFYGYNFKSSARENYTALIGPIWGIFWGFDEGEYSLIVLAMILPFAIGLVT